MDQIAWSGSISAFQQHYQPDVRLSKVTLLSFRPETFGGLGWCESCGCSDQGSRQTDFLTHSYVSELWIPRKESQYEDFLFGDPVLLPNLAGTQMYNSVHVRSSSMAFLVWWKHTDMNMSPLVHFFCLFSS